jgi:hypothetical protein
MEKHIIEPFFIPLFEKKANKKGKAVFEIKFFFDAKYKRKFFQY